MQQRDNPNQVAAQVTASALYGPKHPYGYSEIGTEAALKSVSRADMEAFWKQNFVPNNAALVVAGDISMAELRALAEKAFGGWQKGTPAQPALGAPATTPARVVIVDKPGSPQTQLRVASIGAPRSSPDFRPMQVMNLALGGLFSSRINMNLREEHGYTYGASSQFSFRRAAGPFQIASGVRTDVTAAAVDEIFKEVRGMVDKPVSAEELQKAKDSLANSLPGAFESSANAVEQLLERVHLQPRPRLLHALRRAGERRHAGSGAGGVEEVSGAGQHGGHRGWRSREDRTRAAEAESRRGGDSRRRRQADLIAQVRLKPDTTIQRSESRGGPDRISFSVRRSCLSAERCSAVSRL